MRRIRLLASAGFLLLLLMASFHPSVGAASSTSGVLSYGQVTPSPLASLSDLNNINVAAMSFQGGVLSNMATALWIRPFYYASSADPSTAFMGSDVVSYQTFTQNNTYIIHLRNDTGWSNGQPVTAWDFAASGMVFGGVGAPAYNYKVLDNYTISVNVPVDPAVGLYGLGISSFVFGPDLAATSVLINYNQWLPVVKDVQGNYSQIQAGNSTVIQKLTAEIEAYKSPGGELFSGAYYPTTVSSSEIVLSKNPYYYNAKNLPVNQIDVYQFLTSNAELQYLTTGQLSIYYTYGPLGGSASVPQSYVSSIPSYMRLVEPQGYSGPGVFFNNDSSFVSNVHVRQAIAYALNRTEFALAGGPEFSAVGTPTGLAPYMVSSMCPSTCLSQMAPYGFNLTMAKQQMGAAGYTLKNNVWTSSNGTAISLTLLNSVSTDPGWVNLALDLQSQLQNFGIPVNVLNPANPGTYETSGKGYDMYMTNWGFWVTPWDVFRDLSFLNGTPYPVMHFLGNVSIPINNIGSTTATALQYDILNGAKNVSQEAFYAQGLSYLVNHYLPYLPLANQSPQIYVNSQQFNWPSANSTDWSTALVNDIAAPIMLGQEDGNITLTTTSTATGVSSSSGTGSSTASASSTSVSVTSAPSTSTQVTSVSSSATSTLGPSTTTSSAPPATSTTSTQATSTSSSTAITNVYALGVVIVIAVEAGLFALARKRTLRKAVPPL